MNNNSVKKRVKIDCENGDPSCKMSTSKICTETRNGKCPQEKPFEYDKCCYELPFGLNKNSVNKHFKQDDFFEEQLFSFTDYARFELDIIESVNRRKNILQMRQELPSDDWLQRQNKYVESLHDTDFDLAKLYTFRGDTVLNQFIRSNFSVDENIYKYMTRFLADFQKGIIYMLTDKNLIDGLKEIIENKDAFGDVVNNLLPMNGMLYSVTDKNILEEIGKINKKNVDKSIVKRIYGDFLLFFYNRFNQIILKAPPLDRDIVLYRGVKNVEYFNGAVEKIYQNNGIISTTFSTTVAIGFAGAIGYINRTVVPKGFCCLNMGKLSRFKLEKEIVLPDKTVFYIAQEFKPMNYIYINEILEKKQIVLKTNEIHLLKDSEFKRFGLSKNRLKFPNVNFDGQKMVYENNDIICYGSRKEYTFYVKNTKKDNIYYFVPSEYIIHNQILSIVEFQDFIEKYKLLLSDELWSELLQHYYSMMARSDNKDEIKPVKIDESVNMCMYKRIEIDLQLCMTYALIVDGVDYLGQLVKFYNEKDESSKFKFYIKNYRSYLQRINNPQFLKMLDDKMKILENKSQTNK